MGERKVRSDKKREVKPVLPIHLKKNIYLLSDIFDMPVHELGVILCSEGIHSKLVMDHLRPNFRRGVRLGNTVYFGSLDNPSLQRKQEKTIHERITIRFAITDFEDIGLLAFALDVTPARAVAILLNASIRDPDFIPTLMREHVKKKRLNVENQEKLNKVMAYIKKNNMYGANIDWSGVAKYVVDFVINGWRKVD